MFDDASLRETLHSFERGVRAVGARSAHSERSGAALKKQEDECLDTLLVADGSGIW
jgi:hypothetical protein